MFMIFGNHAINLDLVTHMSEEEPGTVWFWSGSGPILTIKDVTIDQILTAKAAGQSKVRATEVHTPQKRQNAYQLYAYENRANSHGGGPEMSEMSRQHFDDGSKRGQTSGNDPQAINSIGRKR